MKKKESILWFPIWVDKWLWGSTRIELAVEQRSIWIDLLAVASKDDGFIRANVGVPYQMTQLAGMLIVDVKLLEETIEKCIETKKLKRMKDGSLYVCNWKEYQFTDRYRRMKIQEKGEESEFEREFEKFWKDYHPDGRKNKKYAKIRFIALCKQGKLEDFRKGFIGYANYLEYKRKRENFDQSVKYFSTLCADYGEYIQYSEHKSKPDL